MAVLKSRAGQLITQLKSNGKVTTLSPEQTSSIDHGLAISLREIKNDFELKEKNSRAHVAMVELSSFKRAN